MRRRGLEVRRSTNRSVPQMPRGCHARRPRAITSSHFVEPAALEHPIPERAEVKEHFGPGFREDLGREPFPRARERVEKGADARRRPKAAGGRTCCTLSRRPRAPTKQMRPYPPATARYRPRNRGRRFSRQAWWPSALSSVSSSAAKR